tara:strand:- start:212 stop:394 length:183 start_codon:yes stop_codon:yes gene_type:complete
MKVRVRVAVKRARVRVAVKRASSAPHEAARAAADDLEALQLAEVEGRAGARARCEGAAAV